MITIFDSKSETIAGVRGSSGFPVVGRLLGSPLGFDGLVIRASPACFVHVSFLYEGKGLRPD